MAPSRFSLVKWYLDCVTTQGETAILYCADLRWRSVHASYSSVLSTRGHAVESHTSMAPYRLVSTADCIQVEFPRLRVTGQWNAAAAPIQRTVYENASGSVVWNCVQPGSKAHLHIAGREFAGLGYAECLTLSLPPWQLPMRRLRWGRFVSSQDTLAWIDWQGPFSNSFAVHNGRPCELTSVSETQVKLSGAELRMEDSLPLRSGPAGSTILPGAPALAKLLPHSLANIEEHKWRSRGTLQAQEHRSDGWVIHEVVDWKL